jgi:hypothetical protein
MRAVLISKLGFVAAASLLVIACPSGDSGAKATKDAGGAGHGADASVEAEPTFSAIWTDVIVGTGCNGGTLCHGGMVGNLTMVDKATTYKALVGVGAMGTNLIPGKSADCKDSGLTRVVAGKPDESLLMKKIEHMQPCGDPMPPTGVTLPDAKIKQIRTWIMNGAKDD